MLGTVGGSRNPRHRSASVLQDLMSAQGSKACSKIGHKNHDVPWKTKSEWVMEERASEQVTPELGLCRRAALPLVLDPDY